MNGCEIKLSQGLIAITPSTGKTILLVAGGRKPKTKWLQALDAGYTIYAADRGMDYCLEAGRMPYALYGDKDSGALSSWKKAKEENIICKTFSPEKDDTDLQLLLSDLPEKTNILATGIWGGRFDHLYANIFSLLAYKKEKQAQVVMADEKEVLVLLIVKDSVKLVLTVKPSAISLLPMAKESTVSIEGVKWPLEKAVLKKDKPYAISNEALGKEIIVQCHTGEIGLYLNFEGD